MSGITLPSYTVRAAKALPDLAQGWDHSVWGNAEVAEINSFRPESSGHNPRTRVKLLHGPGGIRGVFHVDDQYVRSTRTGYSAQVWKDSCVEFFLHPRADRGYFNLEMNAGGSHLCYYVEDPTRTPTGLKKHTPLPEEHGQEFKVRSSLPATVDPEIREPLAWEQNFFIPLSVLEKYTGPLGELKGTAWRGNFYKCGEDLSHPHWVSWAPVDEFNFHLPRCFGSIRFE